jgi:hypothetical protein
MVVVEHGRSFIGQEVTITVTSVLQTPAGRMIFGRLESRTPTPAPPTRPAGAGDGGRRPPSESPPEGGV